MDQKNCHVGDTTYPCHYAVIALVVIKFGTGLKGRDFFFNVVACYFFLAPGIYVQDEGVCLAS